MAVEGRERGEESLRPDRRGCGDRTSSSVERAPGPSPSRRSPPRRPRGTGRVPVVLAPGFALAATLLAVAACGSTSTAPAPSPLAEPSAAPSWPSSAPSIEPRPEVIPSTPGAATPDAVVADPTLLAILPSTIDGLALVAVPEAVGEAAADPAVGRVVDRMAFAVAVDPVAGDQVVALVAHLRSGSLDPAEYRAWRDSFDREVCERAGGVVGHAELTLGGREVAVGVCAEGVRTYHVLLAGAGLVVSAQSLGERRWGERLMAELGR